MSGEEFFNSQLDDIINWADSIADKWDGKHDGEIEARAILAADLIEKANELKELIAQVSGVEVKI